MDAVNDFADIIHACTTGRVHFHDIHMSAFDNCAAVFAYATGARCGPALTIRTYAIHAFGNNAGSGCFACPTDTCHYKRLRNAIRGKGIFQGADHCILPNQIGKGFWPVFTGKHLIALVGGVRHGTSDFRSCIRYAANVRTSSAMCEVGHE